MLTDDVRFRILQLLAENPNLSQREISKALGMSLGKANYCLRALIERGLVKAQNFRNSGNRLKYMYMLTPNGVEAKAKLTIRFLKRKLREYHALEREIEHLRAEAGRQGGYGERR